MSIILTGSIAYDYLMTFPGYFKDHILPEHLDSISLSFLVDEMTKQPGGVAANIAYTLGLLCESPAWWPPLEWTLAITGRHWMTLGWILQA